MTWRMPPIHSESARKNFCNTLDEISIIAPTVHETYARGIRELNIIRDGKDFKTIYEVINRNLLRAMHIMSHVYDRETGEWAHQFMQDDLEQLAQELMDKSCERYPRYSTVPRILPREDSDNVWEHIREMASANGTYFGYHQSEIVLGSDTFDNAHLVIVRDNSRGPSDYVEVSFFSNEFFNSFYYMTEYGGFSSDDAYDHIERLQGIPDLILYLRSEHDIDKLEGLIYDFTEGPFCNIQFSTNPDYEDTWKELNQCIFHDDDTNNISHFVRTNSMDLIRDLERLSESAQLKLINDYIDLIMTDDNNAGYKYYWTIMNMIPEDFAYQFLIDYND